MPSSHRVGAAKSSAPRSKTDFYPTIQEFADGHVKTTIREFDILHTTQRILDVGFGEGVYGSAVRKELVLSYITGIDVDDSRIKNPKEYTMLYKADFLSFGTIPSYFDLIIGNPPYYEIQDFFEHAISLINDNGIVSFLVKASYLESAARFGWFKKHRPHSVWQAVNRPIKGHAESYVVVNYKKNDTGTTKFGWLLSNKKEISFYE